MAETPHSDGASLMTIPTELLDEVARHLDRSALYVFALTCKRTNLSSTEILYRTYVNREPPSKAPFHTFLRTICERPELADRVRDVDIRGWRSEYEVATGAPWRGLTVMNEKATTEKKRSGPHYSNIDKVVRVSNAERFKIFTEAAVKAGLIAKPESYTIPALTSSVVWYTSMKDDNDFLRLLGRGVEDAQVVLMLALLPNLETLRVDGLSPYPILDWQHFLSRSATALRALQNLQIRGSSTNGTEAVVTTSLQVLDILPNLQVLYLFNVAAAGHQFTTDTLPSKHLSHVFFAQCAVGLRLLRKVLDGQRLTDFTYVPGYQQVMTIKAAEFSTTDIVTRLATSKTTLRHFGLFPIVALKEQPSLKDFSHLTHLEIPHPGILNVALHEADPEVLSSRLYEQIPSTMVTLSLRHLLYNPSTKAILEQLAHLKSQGKLPALAIVRLGFHKCMPPYAVGSSIPGSAGVFTASHIWAPLPDAEPLVRNELGKLYEEAGIQLLIYQTD